MKIVQWVGKALISAIMMMLVSAILQERLLPSYDSHPPYTESSLAMELLAYFVATVVFTGLIHRTKPLSIYHLVLLGIAFGIACSSLYLAITLRTEHYDSLLYEYMINGVRYGSVGGVMGLLTDTKVAKFAAKVFFTTLVMLVISLLTLRYVPGYKTPLMYPGLLITIELLSFFAATSLFAELSFLFKKFSAYQVILLGVVYGTFWSWMAILIVIMIGVEHYDNLLLVLAVNSSRYGIIGGVMALLYILLFRRNMPKVQAVS